MIVQWDHIIDSNDRTFEDLWGFLSYRQTHYQVWYGDFTKGAEIGGFLRDRRRSTWSAFYRYRKDFDHVVEIDTEQIVKKGSFSPPCCAASTSSRTTPRTLETSCSTAGASTITGGLQLPVVPRHQRPAPGRPLVVRRLDPAVPRRVDLRPAGLSSTPTARPAGSCREDQAAPLERGQVQPVRLGRGRQDDLQRRPRVDLLSRIDPDAVARPAGAAPVSDRPGT